MARTLIAALLAASLGCGSVAPADTFDGDTDAPVDTTGDTDEERTCPLQQIEFEASDMDLSGGFDTDTEPTIGDFIFAESSGGGSIDIDVPCEDDWILWGLALWESGGSDSFYFQWDGGLQWVWDVMQQCGSSIPDDWYWDEVSRRNETGSCGPPDEDPAIFHLDAGTHEFELEDRELDAAVARFVLTNDPSYVPPDP